MAIEYPSWLPLPQRANKAMTRQTSYRADQPAVGAPIFQKLTTDVAITWSLSWIFDLRQDRAFNQWLVSPNFLNKGEHWFTMPLNIGGSGLQLQELHFTQDGFPVQTSINGGIVTWTGSVIARSLQNTDDEYDDIIVELSPEWYGILDEVVNRILPEYRE